MAQNMLLLKLFAVLRYQTDIAFGNWMEPTLEVSALWAKVLEPQVEH